MPRCMFFAQNAQWFHNLTELECSVWHFYRIYLPIENIFLITTDNIQNIFKNSLFQQMDTINLF